jgi:hypothetical protein
MEDHVTNLRKYLRDRRGAFGLNDLALMLVVIVGIVGTVYLIFGTSSDDQKIQRAQSQITLIVKHVSEHYGSVGSTVPAGSLNAFLTNSGKMQSMTTPWGDTFNVVGSGGATYTISANFPVSACTSIASRRYGAALQSIQIGGNAAIANIDPAVAATQCAGSGTVTMTFVP